MSIKENDYRVRQASIAEKRISEIIVSQGNIVNEMIKEIYYTLNNFNSFNNERLEEIRKDIRSMKDNLEKSKKEVLEYISKTAPALLYKEEWIRLMSKFTSIGDKVVGIAYRIEQLGENNLIIEKDLLNLFNKFSNEVLNTTKNLREALALIYIDVRKSLRSCEKVEESEKVVDGLYREMDFKILEKPLPLREVILLKEITEMLETISDIAESATDDLRIILLNLL